MNLELDVDNQVHLVVTSSNSVDPPAASAVAAVACAHEVQLVQVPLQHLKTAQTTNHSKRSDNSTGHQPAAANNTKLRQRKNWQSETDSNRPSWDGPVSQSHRTKSRAQYNRACAAGTNSTKLELLQLTEAGCEFTQVGAEIAEKYPRKFRLTLIIV